MNRIAGLALVFAIVLSVQVASAVGKGFAGRRSVHDSLLAVMHGVPDLLF
jgi:hypothetical protein